jgi:hypothetical protein
MKFNEFNLKAAAALQREFDHGRDMNPDELFGQMGTMNVMAVSGGRMLAFKSTVGLPVAHGYWVTVTLDPSDTYTVRRVFVRSGKVFTKREWSDVYSDQVGEVAYQASCYLDD